MILQYEVKNYKVFKERATLSFLASNYDKKTCELENVQNIAEKKLRLLSSMVVYGANAAGKTKLFESLEFFKQFVINSSRRVSKARQLMSSPFCCLRLPSMKAVSLRLSSSLMVLSTDMGLK